MNVLALALIVPSRAGAPGTGRRSGAGPRRRAQAGLDDGACRSYPSAATAPTLAQLIGEKLVVRMDGTTPSADLLGRIKRGEVGGVILLGFNISDAQRLLVTLTGKLRAAAAAGGQPPLLIAVDQEGGPVKRIPWAPPTFVAALLRGSPGEHSSRASAGRQTGGGPPRPRHQRRLRPGRRCARLDLRPS